MRLLPVLDLKDGVVVRGVGGRRHEYQPIRSRLTPSCLPVDVALAFREHFGLSEIYLADLNAIASGAPALPVYSALKSRGFRLLVDAGVRQAADARPLAGVADGIVAGLETISGPAVLEDLCREFGPDRVLFSLDLKEGRPLGDLSGWSESRAGPVVEQALRCGIRRVILLDLARVGASAGTGTEPLCGRLARSYPEVEVIVGGGVRGREDLARLRDCGARAVLVASALHDGRLTREQLAGL